MKQSGNSGALRIIGNFMEQAAARGDTTGMLEHLAVYMAVIKAAKDQVAKGQG